MKIFSNLIGGEKDKKEKRVKGEREKKIENSFLELLKKAEKEGAPINPEEINKIISEALDIDKNKIEEAVKSRELLKNQRLVRIVIAGTEEAIELMKEATGKEPSFENVFISALIFLKDKGFITIPSMQQSEVAPEDRKEYLLEAEKIRQSIVSHKVDFSNVNLPENSHINEESMNKVIDLFKDEKFYDFFINSSILLKESIVEGKDKDTFGILNFPAFLLIMAEGEGLCKITLPKKNKQDNK